MGTTNIDNGKGRHFNEVREISEVNNEGVTVEMLFKDTEVLLMEEADNHNVYGEKLCFEHFFQSHCMQV
jgi:hypothetical protein